MPQTRVLVLALVLCVACEGAPATGDAQVETDADVERDGSADPDAASSCDCCGTEVTSTGGCSSGVCDPWCGLVDPCGGTCDFATNVCVVYTLGSESECTPRPAECNDLANCGGPAPDRSCDRSDPCFEALPCTPSRVARRGNLVEC